MAALTCSVAGCDQPRLAHSGARCRHHRNEFDRKRRQRADAWCVEIPDGMHPCEVCGMVTDQARAICTICEAEAQGVRWPDPFAPKVTRLVRAA